MELYASGFNAHGQLLPSCSPHDLQSFQKVAQGSRIRVRCATWSATVLEIDGVLELRGSQRRRSDQAGDTGEGEDVPGEERNSRKKVAMIQGLSADRIQTIVGDASGILCALTTEGELWFLDEIKEVSGEMPKLVRSTDWSIASLLSWVRHDVDFGALEASGGFAATKEEEEREMVIDKIAVAGNDRVCISIHTRFRSGNSSTFSSTPSTLLTFPSLSSLLSSSPTILSRATLPTPPTSLLGSSTTFQALCDSVPYTWGDARYAHLGRTPSPDSPAEMPFPAPSPPLAEDGHEPRVHKIAAGGWLAASLNHLGDCYIWGGRLGDRERGIGGRDRTGDEDVDEELQRCVDVEGGQADVVDVAVGNGWVLVLTATGKVWGWGDARWGQLGTKGDKSGWVPGWVEIGGWEGEGKEGEGKGKEVVGLECGVWNSFVLTKRKR